MRDELWGPPILRHRAQVELEAGRIESGVPGSHPSASRILSPTYSSPNKRRNSSPAAGSFLREKLKVLKKRHKRYTSPASDDINCVRPDRLPEQNTTSPSNGRSATGPEGSVLVPPKPEDDNLEMFDAFGISPEEFEQQKHALGYYKKFQPDNRGTMNQDREPLPDCYIVEWAISKYSSAERLGA